MLKNSEKIKKFLTVWYTLLIVVSVFLYLAIYYPNQQEAEALNEQQIDLQEYYDELLLTSSKTKLKISQSELDDMVDETYKFVANNSNLSDLKLRINGIMKDISAENISFFAGMQNEFDQQRYKYIKPCDIQIALNADFKGFMRLINEFERSEPLLLVDAFSISASEVGESLHEIKANLKCYSLMPEAGLDFLGDREVAIDAK